MDLTTKGAIEHLINQGYSKYRIAKMLEVAPVSINHWLSGTKMSESIAKRMLVTFKINVTDFFSWSK